MSENFSKPPVPPEMPPAEGGGDLNSAASLSLARSLSAVSDRRIDILRRIGETGSISEAARASGISYKAAWQALESLENLAGGKLAEKAVGGAKGGGTRLTATGRQVIRISDRLAQARAQILAGFSREDQSLAEQLHTGSLLTSMRNILPCTVEDIHHGPAQVVVYLRLDEHNIIKSSITQESAQLLGVSIGMRMLAATKATAIDIARMFPDERYENILRGTVTRCARSEKGGEVTLQLPSGLLVVGFARRGHKLSMGMAAEASVPSKAIVLGLVSAASKA